MIWTLTDLQCMETVAGIAYCFELKIRPLSLSHAVYISVYVSLVFTTPTPELLCCKRAFVWA